MTGRARGSAGPRPLAIRASGALLACLLLGCVAQPRVPTGNPRLAACTPSEAWAATDEGQWDLAAERWSDLFLCGGAGDPVVCREAARALVEIGDTEGALEVLVLGLERVPGHPGLLETHGNVLASMGFRRAAEQSLEDALVTDPDRVSALRSLGRVRLDLDRATAALPPLERCRELGAVDTETRLLHCRALACAGRTEQALEGYVEALAADDVTAADLVRAASLLLDEREVRGCRRKSRSWLRRAVELDPTCAAAHYHLGRIHAERENPDAALAAWRRAIQHDPDHVAALLELANWHEGRGNDSLAARMTHRAEKAARRPGR